MKKLLTVFTVLTAMMIFSSGCKKKNYESEVDQGTAVAIYQAFSEVFAQVQFSATELTQGNVDVTINGPSGGNAHLTGSIYFNEETQRTDWMISCGWWQYMVKGGNYTLKLNGIMTFSGHCLTTGYLTEKIYSHNINYTGNVNGHDVNSDCSIDYRLEINYGHANFSGSMCGRSFSYSY